MSKTVLNTFKENIKTINKNILKQKIEQNFAKQSKSITTTVKEELSQDEVKEVLIKYDDKFKQLLGLDIVISNTYLSSEQPP